MLTYSLGPTLMAKKQQSKGDAHLGGGHQPTWNSKGHSRWLSLDLGYYGSGAAAKATANIWTIFWTYTEDILTQSRQPNQQSFILHVTHRETRASKMLSKTDRQNRVIKKLKEEMTKEHQSSGENSWHVSKIKKTCWSIYFNVGAHLQRPSLKKKQLLLGMEANVIQ